MKKLFTCGEHQFTLSLSKGTIVIVIVIVLQGCSTPRMATQLVHDIQRDTVYLNQIQYDSI